MKNSTWSALPEANDGALWNEIALYGAPQRERAPAGTSGMGPGRSADSPRVDSAADTGGPDRPTPHTRPAPGIVGGTFG